MRRHTYTEKAAERGPGLRTDRVPGRQGRGLGADPAGGGRQDAGHGQGDAEKEGVTGRVSFIKADLFETDFSKASVITMFLLPSINVKLRPKILDLKPGTLTADGKTFALEGRMRGEVNGKNLELR